MTEPSKFFSLAVFAAALLLQSRAAAQKIYVTSPEGKTVTVVEVLINSVIATIPTFHPKNLRGV